MSKQAIGLHVRVVAIAAITVCTQAAWALGPTDTYDIELFMAGATAEKNLLPNLLGGYAAQTRYSFSYAAGTALCTPGTLDLYYDAKSGSRAGYDYRAYSCTLNGSALPSGYSALAGKKVLIHYRMKNGSWYGTGPLIRGQTVTRMKIDSNCVAQAKASTGSTPLSFPLSNVYNTATYVCPTESTSGGVTTINTAQIVNSVPDVGIADNEPAIFVKENAPNDGLPNDSTEYQITASDLNNVTTTAEFLFPLGIAATKKLVNALQTAQGKTVTASGSAVADTDRPSLTFLQVSSLLTENLGPLNYGGWSSILGSSSASNQINICRRISAVATQITSNAIFGNYPCSSNGISPLKPTDNGTDDSGTYSLRVVENDLIPDERNCLAGFNNGANFARGINADGSSNIEAVAAADGNYAIGPLFIDNNPSSESYAWDFVAVDGVNPTVPNVVSGAYRYINTAVINLRNGSDAANTSTLKGKLASLLMSSFKKPALLAVQNGFMALAESGYTAGVDGNNIAKISNGAQTCQPVTLVK